MRALEKSASLRPFEPRCLGGLPQGRKSPVSMWRCPMDPSLKQRLAQFAAGIEAGQLPADVRSTTCRHRARPRSGCCLGRRASVQGQRAGQARRIGGRDRAGDGDRADRRVPASPAAFVNGLLARAAPVPTTWRCPTCTQRGGGRRGARSSRGQHSRCGASRPQWRSGSRSPSVWTGPPSTRSSRRRFLERGLTRARCAARSPRRMARPGSLG